ncbi:MAG: nitroreductase family protein [Bdellovibrionales bacterium]|nr:nitroreductase family protein [Bdellovibrionales bacterium]
MESLPAFEAIRTRRAARHFSNRPIRDQIVYELLELANRAPSGFNLQPWHYVLVRDPELRGLVHHVALQQSQILEAPITVVFVADPDTWKTTYPAILDQSVRSGAMTSDYARFCLREVSTFFGLGPLGVGGFVKRLSLPLRRIKHPSAPALTSRAEALHYVRAHTMLSAATFMVAAAGAGLATCPIEGFDEERLKKLLVVPRSMTIPVIIPVGYAVEGDQAPDSVRTPIIEKLSVDLFPNKLARMKAGRAK